MRSNSVIHSFTLPIIPVAKGRPRMSGRIVFTPTKTRQFENHCKWLMRTHYKIAPMTGPVAVKLIFALKKPKTSKRKYPDGHVGDLDNFIKAVCDAGNGILWIDDCQIVDLHCFKVYADAPAITVEFREIR